MYNVDLKLDVLYDPTWTNPMPYFSFLLIYFFFPEHSIFLNNALSSAEDLTPVSCR